MDRTYQAVLWAVLIFAAGMYTAGMIDDFDHNAPRAAPAPHARVEFSRSNPSFGDHNLPDRLTLCGETVPLDDPRVWEMLDREFNITVWDRAQVFMYLKRAGRYFPFIEQELARAGLPDDLKYLAVAESALLTHSRSPKGAQGPWQFMTPAARSNGLRRDGVVDERLNFPMATRAAIRNLKRLHDKFGSWSLAMAAYNTGETRLARMIRKQETSDYYRLNLPLETERYVFRIAAIKIVMENPQRYGYHLSDPGTYKPQRYDVVEVKTRHRFDLVEVAKALGTDYKDLKELNPQYLRSYLPAGTYILHIPPESGFDALAFFNNGKDRARARILISDRKSDIDRH